LRPRAAGADHGFTESCRCGEHAEVERLECSDGCCLHVVELAQESNVECSAALALVYFDKSRRALLGTKEARREAVIASLAKSSHWHFATHGTFSWTNTAQSALLLADGDRLTVRDLLDCSDLGHPRLVILSGCETGVFDFQRTPDEFIGLPATFLQAGAAGVIGTLWPVDDTSTALIMMKFYNLHFANNMEPSGAAPGAAVVSRRSPAGNCCLSERDGAFRSAASAARGSASQVSDQRRRQREAVRASLPS